MPYKRKAHVLFVSSGEVCRALLATHYAHTLGAEWIEARAVGLDVSARCALTDIDQADQTKHTLDQANIAWADLVVSLDEYADIACPPLPTNVQKHCYPFPQPENIEDLRRVRDAIKQLVEGMIGGMRLMNRCT